MLGAASETNSTGHNLVRVGVAEHAAERVLWASLAARTAARSIVMALQIKFWPSWLGSGFCLSKYKCADLHGFILEDRKYLTSVIVLAGVSFAGAPRFG